MVIGLGQFSGGLTTRSRELLAGSQRGPFSTFDAKFVGNWKILFCHSSEAILLKSLDQLLVFSS